MVPEKPFRRACKDYTSDRPQYDLLSQVGWSACYSPDRGVEGNEQDTNRATKDSCHSIRIPPFSALLQIISDTLVDGMPCQRTEPRTIYQHSKYVSQDYDEASTAWGTILSGHGVVVIEPEYASPKGLPQTNVLPNSGGKHAYVIETYHAMHCLV
jgi:hypothetical protein